MFTGSGVEFYQGLSYRHLMVVRNRDLDLQTTPPHDISGRKVAEYLPQGRDAALINEIMQDSRDAFRQDTGQATSIWLWGQGKRPAMPSYQELYGLKGAAIAAVDLIKGIAGCAGMDIVEVPGATGFIDTNFEGKARYGVDALRDHDYVFIHVEAPDEAGHMGRLDYKLSAIESIDSIMLPILMQGAKELGDCRILLTPDHPTPLRVMTHMAAPVPAIIWGTGIEPDSNMVYTENMKPSFELKDGYKIAAELFR
jgi:2,3-bisphosphoglycerate-independent phosphoglycerate mutase